MAQGQRAGTEHYEEIGDYDYNNPNDTSNFCPGLQVKERRALSSLLSGRAFFPIWWKAAGNSKSGGEFVAACPAPGIRE